MLVISNQKLLAAFKALMACSTMLRNGLYGGSFLSSEFGPGKAAIKADISRPGQQEQMNNRKKARRQGIALGNFRTHLLLHTLQRNIGTITAAKCGQWYRLPRFLNSEEIEGCLLYTSPSPRDA